MLDAVSNQQLIAVVGPTATGKSQLAIAMAGAFSDAAIINADSMQLYRGLNIGTAKTPPSDRCGVPHLLLDVLTVDEEASVARYQTQARSLVEQQWEEGKQPIAVGGSGLYVRALVDQLQFPGTSKEVRADLERWSEREGSPTLHAELQRLDAEAAARIHPNNARRVIRALEVIRITGRPFTANLPDGKYYFPKTVQLAIDWDLEELDRRIDTRTKEIFASGIVEETKQLLDAGLQFGKTASRATGYAQALAVLAGEIDEEEAVQQVALATRQLARRQLKWFRKDPRIVWVEPDSNMLEAALSAAQR